MSREIGQSPDRKIAAFHVDGVLELTDGAQYAGRRTTLAPWTPNASGPTGFGRVNNWNEYMLKLVNGKLALAYPKSFSVESFVTG